MTTVYFAYPVSDYGTPREAAMLATLERLGFRVVNPNHPDHAAAYRVRGMAHFLELAASCDACAYALFPGGGMGAGVGKEVASFLGRRAPVFQIGEPPEPMSVEETRARLSANR